MYTHAYAHNDWLLSVQCPCTQKAYYADIALLMAVTVVVFVVWVVKLRRIAIDLKSSFGCQTVDQLTLAIS